MPKEPSKLQDNDAPDADAAPRISVFGKDIRLPRSRGLRIALGAAFILGGILGFMPILGFWMIPVGLLVLSYEFALIRRWRRKSAVWWMRRRQTGSGGRDR